MEAVTEREALPDQGRYALQSGDPDREEGACAMLHEYAPELAAKNSGMLPCNSATLVLQQCLKDSERACRWVKQQQYITGFLRMAQKAAQQLLQQ